MTWQVQPLPTRGPLFEGAIAVYAEAFAEPPYSDPDRGKEIRKRLRDVHCLRRGFQAFAAIEGHGEVVGMTYGYCGAPGQWWHDTVAATLPRESAWAWLSRSYELVELAVEPVRQGQGIGSALVECLLHGREEDTCVLSTRTDSRAHNLYQRLGFEIVTTMRFVPDGAAFYIMGKRLTREV